MHHLARKSTLPAIEITADDVIAYGSKRSQQPSVREAKIWLRNGKADIEEKVREIIVRYLDEVFDELSVSLGYPDRRVQEQYEALENTISEAVDEYADSIAKTHLGSSNDDVQMLAVVQHSLDHQSFKACFLFENEFGEMPTGLKDRVVTNRTARVHVICDGGELSAEVIVSSTCEHGEDFFVPENKCD